jgi:hypothetical protein
MFSNAMADRCRATSRGERVEVGRGDGGAMPDAAEVGVEVEYVHAPPFCGIAPRAHAWAHARALRGEPDGHSTQSAHNPPAHRPGGDMPDQRAIDVQAFLDDHRFSPSSGSSSRCAS